MCSSRFRTACGRRPDEDNPVCGTPGQGFRETERGKLARRAGNDLIRDENTANLPRSTGGKPPGDAATAAKPKGQCAKFMRSGPKGGCKHGGARIQVLVIALQLSRTTITPSTTKIETKKVVHALNLRQEQLP
jgi:hypothetical protein